MQELCVAIPVGGVVNEKYLEYNLKILRESGCLVYVGLDSKESLVSTGNYRLVKEIVYQYADRVLEFPPEFYYRPGGIWKKIFDCWRASKAPYVRALGYDDYLPTELIKKQHAFMVKKELDGSYSNQLVVDEVKNGEIFTNTELGKLGKIRCIGKNPFSFICWQVRAAYILTEEFESKLMRASLNFECLFHTYLLKGCSAHFNSAPDASAVRREHQHTVSHLAQTGVLTDFDARSAAMREITGYSLEQTKADWHTLHFSAYVKEIRKSLSPLGAILAELEDKIRGVPYI